MKIKLLLSIALLLYANNKLCYSQFIQSVSDETSAVTISTEALQIQVNKDPWQIMVSDKAGNVILQEKENNVFEFGSDRISAYKAHTELGYDTIVKRDPHIYHLYDESVIIGEIVEFDCATANSANSKVYITFRSPYVFSVWMTYDGAVQSTKHSFESGAGEHFFGLGECWDAQSLDLKGLSVAMNNRTGTPDQGGYIPFYVSTRGYGILVDNNLNVNFNFSRNSTEITAPPISNSEDGAGYFNGTSFLYYFYYGPDLLDVIDRFTEHVSRPALPPSWAVFTTWQWRDTNTESGVYDDAEGMRNANIPCGLIWIDRPWAQGDDNMPPPFEWQASRYPNGPQMFDDLNDMGYKTGVWVARNLYGSFADSLNYIKLKNDTRDWLIRDSAQMYKIDRGNVQSSDPLFTCQAYYEAWDEVFDGDFVTLPRTIANRAQQYVSGKWPGDNDNTYDFPSGLKANIPAMLNLAITGFPFWGADTGGFPDPPGNNVTARWSQFSAFCTLFETAGTPYNYSSYYKSIYKKYAELYTRLFPYRWTYSRIAHEKGHPVARALALHYPNDPDAYGIMDEYMFGDWFLVAPVVSRGTSRDIYLPEGVWYDWWNGTKYEGPMTIDSYPAPEDKLPLFVKEGGIIPLIETQDTWLNSTMDPMTFRIFPSENSSFNILGDTIIYPHKSAPYTQLKSQTVECEKSAEEIRINFDSYAQAYIFEVFHPVKPEAVSFNGESLIEFPIDITGIDNDRYYYESDKGILYIKVSATEQTSNTINISLPATSVNGEFQNNLWFDVFPNPVNESSAIVFNLLEKTRVEIEIVDIMGRNIADVTKKEFSQGNHEIKFPSRNLRNGMYFIRLKAFGQSQSKLIVFK